MEDRKEKLEKALAIANMADATPDREDLKTIEKYVDGMEVEDIVKLGIQKYKKSEDKKI